MITPRTTVVAGETKPKPDAGAKVTPEGKSSTLIIKTPELKALTLDTPEKRAETVTLSEYSYNTLLNTLTFHYPKLDEMLNQVPPDPVTALHKTFYQEFKRLAAGEDLKDPEKLKKVAEKFLARGGAEVRLSLKLAEWQAATLQAASGREFVKGKKDKTEKMLDGEEEVVFIQTADGAVVESHPAGSRWQRWRGGKDVVTKRNLRIKGGKVLTVDATNTMLSAEQQIFLAKSGWTNRNLNAEELATIDSNLSAVAALRTELFSKTGLTDLSKIELNFIKNGAGGFGGKIYIDNKTGYFIGETTVAATSMRTILEAEGVTIATEVKTKVQKEIDKKLKEESERVIATNTVAKLREKLKKIEGDSKLSDEQKQIRTTEIQAEITKLNEQSKLFSRARLLPGEIAKAKTDRDDAEKKLGEWAGKLGVSANDLKNWSDPRNANYLAKKKEALDKKNKALEKAIAELEKNNNRYAEILKANPGLLGDTAIPDGKGGTIIIPKVVRTDPEIKKILDRLDKLDTTINTLEGKIGDSSSGLTKEADDLEAEYGKIKGMVEENPEVKALCEKYHLTNNEVTNKEGVGTIKGEIDDVSAKIADLIGGGRTAAQVKDVILNNAGMIPTVKNEMEAKDNAIEKTRKDREEEIPHLGEPLGEKKTEMDSIEALIYLYEPTGKQAYEDRFKKIESDEPVVTTFTSEWANFPGTIQRIAHLLVGDEVMLGYETKKDLAEQVLTLMKSKKYLDIIIDKLEASTLPMTIAAPAAAKGPAGPDGLYPDINTAIQAGAKIRTITPADINSEIKRDLVLSILDEMRKQTIEITTI